MAVILLVAALVGPGDASAGAAIGPPVATPHVAPGDDDLVRRDWVWPLAGFRIARGYAAPAHEYGPGHRGIDLEAVGGPEVRAPAAGVVAFVGSIAGRGIVTIDHGDGLVTTLEPVVPGVEVGASVERGQEVAVLSVGGHAATGTLHFGVRRDGEYINPLLLLGGIPRAVLLPCCADLP